MQEILIKLVCWFSLVSFGYILLVCILAEMSLGRPKIKDGILQVRKDSFVISNIYKNNQFLQFNCDKKYPRDICQLFWGIFWGFPANSFIITMTVFIGSIIYLVVFFGGFIPDFNSKDGRLHPYQTYTKKSGEKVEVKKFIAPWKIILGFIVWYQFALQPDRTFGIIAKTPGVIAELFLMAITELFVPVLYFGAICLLIYFIYFIVKKTFTATSEFLKSKNKKVCIDVDLV